jgi:hypothetical protein
MRKNETVDPDKLLSVYLCIEDSTEEETGSSVERANFEMFRF